ncbi:MULTISPECIES: EexN family lipoprotein [unclassified Bartonella]|uniref:EexN family lipoprotein n=1 Tax=unclassified Bartonella TaxID=2645622 RepID=UPI00235FE763|nr:MULTISPECIES: EexN family lipoprotein [unclassified Bartonella]
MNKVLITTLLLCTGIIAAGCEKTYSVAEFKKDQKLMEEWGARCGFTGTSKNCENLRLAALELDKERREKAAERISKHNEELRDAMEKFKAEMRAQHEKNEAEYQKRKAEQEAKKQAEKTQSND